MTDIPWHELNPRLQPDLGRPQIIHKTLIPHNAPQQPKNTHPTDTQTTTPPNNTNWQNQANCKNATHLMFPKEHKDITYIAQARKICAECEVKPQCLTYALNFPAGDMHGVWAGLTPRQLAAEQRRQNIRPTIPTLAQMWSDLTRG
jgi:WhiB family redox-sensing transcriptional regulator